MKLKVAVNQQLKNKEKANVVDGWKNVYVNIEWLMGWVAAGHGWCATHFRDRYRKSENVEGSNMIVIDFDGDTTLETFWQTTTAKDWCAGTYTSASHTDKEHRFRAIFPLEIELSSAAQHKGAYWLIVNRLLVELGLEELKDNCGQKAERLWFGNTNTITSVYPDNCVPAFLLDDIDYEETFDLSEQTSVFKTLNAAPGYFVSSYVPVMMENTNLTTFLFWQLVLV